jgi:ABC-2 type transport system permease protein
MVVLMFRYLFGGQMRVPGGGGYAEFLLPGMYAMTMAFGFETTFAAISGDAAKGVTDRFRSLPMASALALTLMIACGLAVGWRWHDGVGRALAAVALLLLLRFALLWAGIYLGLIAGNPELLAAVQILVWPVGFLSNVFAAPSPCPAGSGRRRVEPAVGHRVSRPGATAAGAAAPGRRSTPCSSRSCGRR